MPDEDIYEDQDSIPDGDTTLPNEPDDNAPSEDPEKVTLLKQKEHWRNKAIDPKTGKPYKELYEEATKPKEEPTPEPTTPQAPQTGNSEDIEEKITRVRLEAKGYNEDEQEVILKASKVLGIDAIKAAQDDLVQAKINQMREEVKVNNAIPAPSGKAGSKDTNSIDYYLESGEIPEDDDLADKVDVERVRRARQNY